MTPILFKQYPEGPGWLPGNIVETKQDPICGVYFKIITSEFPFPVFRLEKEVLKQNKE